ncbi:molybdopterin/thiamine biosynthesis adenylyltransferase [Shimia isoporae]|uniref:Molybdopterin/thiamine biosynthesis adenylyltransferase n=1 Tax=Shimia isoporae TaxID=647720 RepID=A0A4R1N983_9RHOB|nr:HesA/MoeB/ThiF family protein [Shimia isoporae]TCL00342.1 molybdopterin/thiamine biosynthesis adenylyltransferase [Shimia isoporae]
MNRYARQTILPEVGETGQAKLSAAKILVVGAGGLAAPVLPLLATAGIGQITIIDGDFIDLSNLHRQTLFGERDCGRLKAETAAARLMERNSGITVHALSTRLTPDNALGLLAEVDLVLDCADNYAVSYLLSDLCLEAQIPLISASVLAFGGYVGGFCAKAPSLRAVFPEAPESAANCATAGVLGPVVGVIGAMQAQMALNTILQLEPSPLGHLFQLDARTMRASSFRFDDASEPATAFRFVSAAALTATDTIIDLRSVEEAPKPAHPKALRILPQDLAKNLTPKNQRLALCCQTGLRAWRTAENIQSIWPDEIVLVAASAS